MTTAPRWWGFFVAGRRERRFDTFSRHVESSINLCHNYEGHFTAIPFAGPKHYEKQICKSSANRDLRDEFGEKHTAERTTASDRTWRSPESQPSSHCIGDKIGQSLTSLDSFLCAVAGGFLGPSRKAMSTATAGRLGSRAAQGRLGYAARREPSGFSVRNPGGLHRSAGKIALQGRSRPRWRSRPMGML